VNETTKTAFLEAMLETSEHGTVVDEAFPNGNLPSNMVCLTLFLSRIFAFCALVDDIRMSCAGDEPIRDENPIDDGLARRLAQDEEPA